MKNQDIIKDQYIMSYSILDSKEVINNTFDILKKSLIQDPNKKSQFLYLEAKAETKAETKYILNFKLDRLFSTYLGIVQISSSCDKVDSNLENLLLENGFEPIVLNA